MEDGTELTITLDDLAKDSYGKLRLYRRRLASGLVQMVRDGDLDVFDALAVAPLILDEERRQVEAAEYERRRLAWLAAYLVDDDGNEEKGVVIADTPISRDSEGGISDDTPLTSDYPDERIHSKENIMSDTMPISMLKTQAAKNEVAYYRRIGLLDDEMGFVVDGEAELVVTSKAGLMKLMKSAPIGRAESLRRMLGTRLVNYDGSTSETPSSMRDFITLDDEIELFRDDVVNA